MDDKAEVEPKTTLVKYYHRFRSPVTLVKGLKHHAAVSLRHMTNLNHY